MSCIRGVRVSFGGGRNRLCAASAPRCSRARLVLDGLYLSSYASHRYSNTIRIINHTVHNRPDAPYDCRLPLPDKTHFHISAYIVSRERVKTGSQSKCVIINSRKAFTHFSLTRIPLPFCRMSYDIVDFINP